MKRTHPVARCTACGKTSHFIGSANTRCPERSGNKRCKGTMRSAVCVGDWKECENCSATGIKDGSRCDWCNGDGHLYVRDRQ